MAAHQCPDCDLRFASESDLDDHLRRDHPEFKAEPRSDVDRAVQELRRGHRRQGHGPKGHPDTSP